MCESIPSVTLWGTTQLTSTITTSTIVTTQVAQSTRLLTSQVITREIITSLVPQQTLYYPCSESEGATQPARPAPAQSRPATTQGQDEGSVDPNATGQFTGSLPTQTRATTKSLSFTSPTIKSTSISSSSTIENSVAYTSSASASSSSSPIENGEGSTDWSTAKSNNSGIIAGAVVGGIFGMILLVIILMCCQKRRARRRRMGSAAGEDWNDTSGGGGNGDGNDYWERRFREIESANSSRGNGLGLNGMEGGRGEKEKGDWDSQTSKKLRLTLDLGSKDLPSRPPSRLSMISSFFGGRMTPTPNVMASLYHSHSRTGSTPTLRSTFGNGNQRSRRPSTKGSESRFSFNPFRRHQQNKHSYSSNQFLGQNQFPNLTQDQRHMRNHSRSISSPWVQEDSRSSKSTGTGGNRSAGYSTSNKSPGARPSLEDRYHNNVDRTGSKSIHQTANTKEKRHSQSTFGKKMSSFDQPPIATFKEDHTVNNVNNNNNNNGNSTWSYHSSDFNHTPVQPPPQAMTTNTQSMSTTGLTAVREGRVIESPTEEDIEERRNMEWIRHSTIPSDQGEGEETLDNTDEEKMNELESQLGIDELGGLPDISIFKNLDNPNGTNMPPKPYLGFGQFNPSIGNTPPQLGAIGTYTSSNSHLSGISTIPSLPPATTRGGYSSGISSVGSSSFIPFIPPPKSLGGNGTVTSHLSGISSNGSATGTGGLTFIPPIRGGHGSLSGLSITPSTVLPRGYLSGLSSAHSFTNRTIRPKSPDSVSIPSDIIINGHGQATLLKRINSQSTVSSYSTHPVSPCSTQPSFGVSRPNSQFSDSNTNRNTGTLTFYRPERRSSNAGYPYPYPPVSRRSSSIKLKRTPSGRVVSSIVHRDSSLLPSMPGMGVGMSNNRKSAFQDADEDGYPDINGNMVVDIPALPPPPAVGVGASIPEKIPSPPPTSFLIPENISRRSLKNQRESKGKHVPKIRLSQRALTPSLWIDGELLARFAASQDGDDEGGSNVTFDDTSTVKPTPVKEKNTHLRTKSKGEGDVSRRDSVKKDATFPPSSQSSRSRTDNQLDTEERPLISRFSNSTQPTISRNNSTASTTTTISGGNTMNGPGDLQNGSVSRMNSNVSVNDNRIQSNERPITPSQHVNTPNESGSYLSEPTSLTPRPRPRPKSNRKQSLYVPKDQGKGKAKEITILSPHTPPNKLPLFSPPFPKPPTPPLPFSTWVQESHFASSSTSSSTQGGGGGNKDFRFSIKQRRKQQNHNQNQPNDYTEGQGQGQGLFEIDDESGHGHGKSVVTPQLPFLTLGSLSTNSSVTDFDVRDGKDGTDDWRSNRKKSAYEDADEGENEFVVDKF
ncbi:hypothetical protein L486_07901 [Kwoniella mangroviensis CBS 10435]|uniref:Uncharacterized protein n=1 Tax=Kwoniella mangroviensis CBS 10435 TaxID=1331196 RepID=A0A1B9IGS7_9TREE|nr:hypothetical protein L486_07901 [Kwoniella mangroviensis CBS 10435]